MLGGQLNSCKTTWLPIDSSQESNGSVHAPGHIYLVADPDIVGGGHRVTVTIQPSRLLAKTIEIMTRVLSASDGRTDNPSRRRSVVLVGGRLFLWKGERREEREREKKETKPSSLTSW